MVAQCSSSMTIRAATAEDLPALRALLRENECLLTLGAERGDEAMRTMGQKYVESVCGSELKDWDSCAAVYAKGASTLWVLESDGRIRGSVGVLDDGGESVELVRMYTDRTVRRRGLGRRLLDHLLAHARSACPAARSVWLSTPTANTPGLEFYEAVGFAVEEDFTPPGGWAPELRRFRRRLEPSYCCS